MTHALKTTRKQNYADWYQEVVSEAELAEHAPVRGCMVIKPWGYALWESIQRVLDRKLKETGHQNAYFPLFIPVSFLEQEAQHVEGFAKECAVVTHHRLEQNKEGKLIPVAPLEEPYVVRPTSEMIIGAMFAKWVESYRDLPLRINQWANVVRWEMRTRLFLRTTEFLWQEGHAVYASAEEAQQEARLILDLYAQFARDHLAIPMIRGEKSASERFPGAVATYCIEAMMQDRKALQAGTSHFLGQNFSKAQGICFCDEGGVEKHAWTGSWGVTTRLIGALVMTHADDDGMVIPPRIAATHLVILPIVHKEENRVAVHHFCNELAASLSHVKLCGEPLGVVVDRREGKSGDKKWCWVKKGVPLRLEIGMREVESGELMLNRRDLGPKEGVRLKASELATKLPTILQEMQDALLAKAEAFQKEHIRAIDSRDELYEFFTPKNLEQPEIHGGFAFAHWSEGPEVEEQLKRDLGVTLRCIPLEDHLQSSPGVCPISGKKSLRRVLFAKAY